MSKDTTSSVRPDPPSANRKLNFREVAFGSDEQREAVSLRDDHLRKPLGVAFRPGELEAEVDDWHLAGFDAAGWIHACMLLTPSGEGRVKMRQVVVHPLLRNAGVGSVFLKWAEEFAVSRGISFMYCHARDEARRFYERAGYQVVGDAFTEVGLKHWRMEKVLPTVK